MSKSRIALLGVLAALVVLFFAFDLGRFFSLGHLKTQQAAMAAYVQDHLGRALLGYFLIYVAVTGLSLPGAAVMTLAGGAVFGFVWAALVVSVASTIGATLAFLASRFLFRDLVQRRFGSSLTAINRGVERDGAFYLFGLRLVPVFPFFVINLVMGLTPIRTATFFWVSQVGMLPGTLVYVNAGTQLGRIESLRGILSPELLVSFALLGVFPLLAKKLVGAVRARQALGGYARPKRFDRNLVVIGAGSAGLVAAYIAAAVKAKVTLIEKHRMGGDCLNTGCVPSKALIRSARFLGDVARAQALGFRKATAEFDFAEIMARMRRVIRTVEPHDSVERYTQLGVECVEGAARITSPWTVEVGGRRIATRAVVVATGARPFVPPIPGLRDAGYLTSDTVWELTALPRRLVVLGGGPIGCELAQCFARFGAEVTVVEMLPRLLPREDEEISALVEERFRREGIRLLTGHRAAACRAEGGRKILVCEREGAATEIECDEILVAVGRAANTTGFGLEELGIHLAAARTIEVNEYLQTRIPTIYACGDAVGPYQFTHAASHQAWFAAVNALFGGLRRFRVDYSVIPWCTFTDPEVARVGLNELEARERGVPYEVTRYGVDDLDRAIADEAAEGVVKVLTVPGKDRILGATIVAAHAGEMITEFVSAMKHSIGLGKILGTIHIYPTMSEANKYAAGAWKRAHTSARTMRLLERYHGWLRR
jgi:pyruvate/2-oxoglutarate dehydrogenase complex dihydrolipoamide dehydrogenase (E3) component/uncharacterized membrane protein YdjX (TVP38/TMEM64 family)